MSGSRMYERKCPFHLPSDKVEFDNMPGFQEQCIIRTFHFLQRIVVQAGGLQSSNPITKIFAFIFYVIDLFWAGADKQYYVKRKAMYGPNFISTLSLVISKYDEMSTDKDSIDAMFTTIPQRRGFYLGSTIMNPKVMYYYGKDKKCLTPLFVSDPGATMDPLLPADQPDHNVLQGYLMQHFLGADKIDAVIARQKDENGTKLLAEFGKLAKGKSGPELSEVIFSFLPTFVIYTLFDVPIDKIPLDDVNASYTSLQFVFHHYGPAWTKAPYNPKPLREALDNVAAFLSEHSTVLQDVPDGPAGLTKADLIEMIHFIFGIAGFQGTRALATTSMTQMPEGYAESVANDKDSNKLRNAILECARLDTPVTGAHSIVDDQDGITTKIGRKTLKFPRGTILFNAMTIANVDERRYGPNPFVFDPENRDFSKLTSFQSVGETTGPGNRICPGRYAAVSAVELMIKAKVASESSADEMKVLEKKKQ